VSFSSLQPITIAKAPRYREAAYSAIKEAILAGRFAPEQPLIEEQLAAELNISRTPVREALAILEHEGLIGPRGGRGLFVRTLTRAEFIEMFVANETVEPYLARRAALLAVEAQLRTMSEAIQRGLQAAEAIDEAGFLRASRDFHRLVGEAAGNATLAQFVLRNEEHTDMYLLNYGKVVDVTSMRASVREHEAIFAAITQRDPEAAARVAIYHAHSLRERFAMLFNSSDVEEDGAGTK
jgi:DNA-binding GntR family transcriptional regulator